MLEKNIFEYAVIRFVPKVEREEFLNVGVILYCAKKHFLATKCRVDAERISSFHPGADLEELTAHLKALESISKGEKEGGPIALLDIAARFRWLTATRSTIVQTSKVHPGYCTDAGETLERLFNELVLQHFNS